MVKAECPLVVDPLSLSIVDSQVDTVMGPAGTVPRQQRLVPPPEQHHYRLNRGLVVPAMEQILATVWFVKYVLGRR